jgi:hypothetical protein
MTCSSYNPDRSYTLKENTFDDQVKAEVHQWMRALGPDFSTPIKWVDIAGTSQSLWQLCGDYALPLWKFV